MKPSDRLESVAELELALAEEMGKPSVVVLLEEDGGSAGDLPSETRLVVSLRARAASLSPVRTSLHAHVLTAALVHAGRLVEEYDRYGPDGPGWQPRIAHPLQPARHFCGRDDELDELRKWWSEPAAKDFVFALEGIGGCGKTALADRFLREILQSSNPAGIFVWSFYESDDLDLFLTEAATYFGDDVPATPSARLESLKRSLSTAHKHFVLLDGLERVQSEGGDGRARGELADHAAKALLRFLTQGFGRTRVLITTRFPVCDLANWEGRGYRRQQLGDLSSSAAVALLREWGVRGSRAQLEEAAVRFGNHALSVSVLGSFIGSYWKGDIEKALDLSVDHFADTDNTAAKLRRLLSEYGRKFDKEEQQLMGWLCAFSYGLKESTLRVLLRPDSALGGVLAGVPMAQALQMLTRFEALGLAFAYKRADEFVFTAHPFLRDHFRNLLLSSSAFENIHKAVRGSLLASLTDRPSDELVSDAEQLSCYEELIRESVQAGLQRQAFDIYWKTLGHYEHLGRSLGDFPRVNRIMRSFLAGDSSATAVEVLSNLQRSLLLNDWALAAKNLGELGVSVECFRSGLLLDEQSGDSLNRAIKLRNLSEALTGRGELGEAEKALRSALKLAEGLGREEKFRTLTRLGYVRGLAGSRGACEATYHEALVLRGPATEWGLSARGYAECLARFGQEREALQILDECAKHASEEGWGRTAARVTLLRVWLRLDSNRRGVTAVLRDVADWALTTGDMEIMIELARVRSRLHRRRNELEAALIDARDGRNYADGFGWSLFSVLLRCEEAANHLAAERPELGVKSANEAVGMARKCGFAWGLGDALHLLGRTRFLLGELNEASNAFKEAVAIRRSYGDPGAEESARRLEASSTSQ